MVDAGPETKYPPRDKRCLSVNYLFQVDVTLHFLNDVDDVESTRGSIITS